MMPQKEDSVEFIPLNNYVYQFCLTSQAAFDEEVERLAVKRLVVTA
jgi:hypothetical protein